jgi:hypothetical protein
VPRVLAQLPPACSSSSQVLSTPLLVQLPLATVAHVLQRPAADLLLHAATLAKLEH